MPASLAQEKPAKPDKPNKPAAGEKIPKSERGSKNRSSERSGDRSSSSTAASTSSTPAAPGSPESFRIIAERNIFNPNRTGRSRASEETPMKIDTIALVGTMESDKGLVAFFESADQSYRKAAQANETFGGITVKKISPNAVQLIAGERELTVRVNQQLRRVEGGDWRVTARDPSRGDFARTASERPASNAPALPVIPSDASDVLRRLMEQRQKQLKQ